MRVALLLLLLVVVSACTANVESPRIDASSTVQLQCLVLDRDCTTSYRLAMEAVDPRFARDVVRASVRISDVRLCPDGDPRYDVELTDINGKTIEVTVAVMRDGELVACTY